MRNVATEARDRVGEALLRFSKFEDSAHGRIEEQRFLETDRGRVLVTLVDPIQPRHSVAFLLCHSFAHEQFELFPMELRFARAAAQAGFSAACFQAGGYGDAGGSFEDVTPSSHIADAVEVGRSLLARSGVESIVPVGARFGSYVAWSAARDLDSPGAALWNPSLSPVRYLDGLLKAFVRTRMMSLPSDHPGRYDTDGLRERLLAGGSVDLFGYPLTSTCYVDAQMHSDAVHLPDPIPRRAHLVVVNPRNRREASGARGVLAARGVAVSLDEVDGSGALEFALGVPIGGHLATHARLLDDVGNRTLRWALTAW